MPSTCLVLAAADSLLLVMPRPLQGAVFLEVHTSSSNMFGSEKHQAKAVEIGRLLLKELPPSFVISQAKLLSVNRVTHAVENVSSRVSAYVAEARLGFLGRSLFLNALKWQIKELGYPDDFSSLVTEAALMASMKKRP